MLKVRTNERRSERRAEVNEMDGWMCAGFVHAFDPPTSNV